MKKKGITEVTVTTVDEVFRYYNKYQRRIIGRRLTKGIDGEDVMILTIRTY